MKKQQSCAMAIVFATFGLAAQARGQTTSVAGGAPIEPQEEVIIVTHPLEGKLESALQGVTVLSKDELNRELGSGLGETLARQPGISSSQFGAGASRPIIRGLGEDRVRILENGIGSIDASAASPDHAATGDGLDADRIEVLRGAAALAFGGNALGGVVNVLDGSLITEAPDQTVTSEMLARFGTVDGGLLLAGRVKAAGNGFGVTLSAAKRDADAYDIPGFTRSATARVADPLPGEVEGTAPNSFAQLDTLGAGVSAFGSWGYLGMAVKRTSSNYGLLPEEIGEPGGQIDLEQTKVELRGDLKTNLAFARAIDFAAQSAQYEHAEIEGSGEVATVFTNDGIEARLEAHHGEEGDAWQGAYGLQFVRSDFAAKGEEAFLTPTETRDIGVFVVEHWEQGKLSVEFGLRHEKRDLDNVLAGDYSFDLTSASLGGGFRPAEHWFVGVNLSQTMRAPTAVEMFADGPHLATESFEIGNTALGAETARSVEGSLRFHRVGTKLEVNVYRVDFDDYIALLPTGEIEDGLDVYAYEARDARFWGGEIVGRSVLATLGKLRISGEASLDLVEARFGDGSKPPRIPPAHALLGVEADYGRLTGRLSAEHWADQTRIAPFETETDGTSTWHADLEWRLGDDARGATLFLQGRNLANAEIRVHTSFLKDELPRPGRDVRLGVRAKF